MQLQDEEVCSERQEPVSGICFKTSIKLSPFVFSGKPGIMDRDIFIELFQIVIQVKNNYVNDIANEQLPEIMTKNSKLDRLDVG